MLIAYHGQESLKESALARMRAHREADQLVQGYGYWRDGKGCAVGCLIHGDSHAQYEPEFGIPQLIARLEDATFEGLDREAAIAWPERFLSAIPVGADLSMVGPRFSLWLLRDSGLLTINDVNRDAINGVIALYAEWIESGLQPDFQRWAESAAWSAAESAESSAESAAESAAWSAAWSAAARSAWSAESAARSAAESAAWTAWSAESAARSAAWSAAESAESAARSAWSAARSAESVAESAAWSAAESAESAARSARSAARSAWSAESAESAARSAWSAARSAARSAESAASAARSASAAWKLMSDKLAELLSEAPVPVAA